MGLYTVQIKEAFRGGPHRVAVFSMFQTHWLGGFIWIIKALVFQANFMPNYCAHFYLNQWDRNVHTKQA